MDVCGCGAHFCRTSFACETELAGDVGPVSARVPAASRSGPVAGRAGHTVEVGYAGLVSVVVLAQLCARGVVVRAGSAPRPWVGLVPIAHGRGAEFRVIVLLWPARRGRVVRCCV